jgi:hypothetical protein
MLAARAGCGRGSGTGLACFTTCLSGLAACLRGLAAEGSLEATTNAATASINIRRCDGVR